jgi:hypothetical protein
MDFLRCVHEGQWSDPDRSILAVGLSGPHKQSLVEKSVEPIRRILSTSGG